MENISNISMTVPAPNVPDTPKVSDSRDTKEPQTGVLKAGVDSAESRQQKADTLPVSPEPKSSAGSGRFSIHFDTDGELNIIVAKIIDQKTGDIVSQIPPEQMFKTMKYFKENPGRLVSRQA